MNAIPRLIAGTAIVLAAVLSTAPVTAGIADLLLNPGPQPTKRVAAQALTGVLPPVTTGSRDDDDQNRGDDGTGGSGDAGPGTDPTAQDNPTAQGNPTAQDDPTAQGKERAGLVANTAVEADSRVMDLAGDLQSGVLAGEFSQADADRVLGDLSSYIRGERTWPERSMV